MNINIFIASYLLASSPKHFNVSAYNGTDISMLTFNDLVLDQHIGISVVDRSVNYGDGCFTTMYYEYNNLFLVDQHLLRLEQDAHKLGISVAIDTIKYWLIQACENLLTNEIPASAIKILVSRGTGGRGYEPPLSPTTQIIISFYPTEQLDVTYEDDRIYNNTVQVANMRLSSQPLLAGIKHLNRLEQVLAKQELQLQSCDDLLLCNQTGSLVEATSSNIFYLNNGVWTTPDIIDCGVSGVMRNSILEFMQMHEIQYEIKITNVQDILHAESLFLCNSIKFIVPVSNLYTQGKYVDFKVSPSFQKLTTIYEWLNSKKLTIIRATT